MIINPYMFPGGGSFVPTDISGCKLWLPADYITGLSDGDPVSTWDDESGSGNDATQTGGNRPTYQTNEVNSLPAIQFDGSDDSFEIADNSSFEMTGDVTFSIVLKTSTILQALIGKTADAAAAGAFFYQLFTGLYPNVDRPFVEAGVPATNPVTAATWTVISVKISGTTVSHRLNGTANGTDTLTTGTATNAPIRIGVLNIGANSQWFPGLMAEIVGYDNAISDGNLDTLENYLGAKYAITITH